jgi:hypothetical protein
MAAGPPSPVRELQALGIYHNEVVLYWKPPREANGVLKGFWIQHCPISERERGIAVIDEDDCVESTFLKPERTYFRVTGLEQEKEYRFIVKAESDGGLGNPNSVDAETLPPDVLGTEPVAPGLEESGVGTDYVKITWIPGTFEDEDDQPVGTEHYVKYRVKGAKDWQTAEPKDGNLTLQVGNLDPGTTYEIQTVSVAKYSNGSVMG